MKFTFACRNLNIKDPDVNEDLTRLFPDDKWYNMEGFRGLTFLTIDTEVNTKEEMERFVQDVNLDLSSLDAKDIHLSVVGE